MAGKKIKGITIELDGDTKGLDKALSGVNKQSVSLSKELKDVDKLLKFDPTNVVGLQQKQDLLTDSIENTSKKLNALKQAQNEVEAQFKSGDIGEETYREFQREIQTTENVLDGYKKKLSNLEVEQESLGTNTKRLETYFQATGTEIDNFSNILGTRLVNSIKSGKASAGQLETALAKIAAESVESRTDIDKFKNTLDSIDDGNSIGNIKEELSGLSTEANDSSEAIEDMAGIMSGGALLEAADALQGLSDKMVEVGKSAFDSALAFGDSQTYLQANLGLTEEQAESLNKVVQDVFKNGVVESVEEAAEAVSIVKSSFSDLNNVDLQELTNQLTVISKRTGTDVAENTNSAKKMMQEFGLTSTEAMNLLAAGYQNNLNKSDDFTDTINEYAPLFAEAGYSGEEMFALLSAGMEAGARNSDLVADAVKEMQIRFGDGSFEKNLESFSEGTGDLFGKWQEGKATMSEVMGSIATDMQGMTTAEQQEALSLLSTQFEDLGIDASLAILGVNDGLGGMKGNAEQMAEVNPTEKFQQGLRELQELLLPIGEKLMQLALEIFPKIIEAVQGVYEWFTNLSEPMQTFITSFGGITAVVILLAPIIATVVAGFIAFGATMGIVIGVIIAVIGVIAGIIVIIKNWGAITDWLGEKWSQFKAWLSATVGAIASNISTKFSEMKSKMTESISAAVSSVKTKASEMKASFLAKVSELKSGATQGFQNMKDGVMEKVRSLVSSAGTKFTEIKEKIMTPINNAKDAVKTAIDKMKSFFDFNWKLPSIKMPKFSVSGSKNPMDWIKEGVPKLSVSWNAMGGIFNKPTILNSANGLQGVGEAGSEAILPLNEKTLGGIGKGIADAMGSTKGNNSPIYLQVDGRTFAKLIGNYTESVDGTRIRSIGRGLAT